jgi:methionine--tRNA ligase beta chain
MIKDTVSFPDFIKLDLRIGTIQLAEKIDGSDRLIRMKISLGEELGERQIIAGIALYYSPEDLVGRQVVVLVNLEAKKMMGIESEGMVLAAGDEDVVLLTASKKIPDGSIIR